VAPAEIPVFLPLACDAFYITVLLALAFPARPAHAQMIVAGPSTPTTQALENWYGHQLPAAFHARNLVAVHPLFDADMDAYLKANGVDPGPDASSHADKGGLGQVDGIFINRPARISLRLSPSGTLDLLTAAHEYGHYVWFNLLNKDERRNYKDIYERQKRSGQLISDYAASNLEEGFAEAFAFYVNEPVALAQTDDASCRFFQTWIARHGAAEEK